MVGKGFAHDSIKSAVAQASAGDTIIITEGLYKEGNIRIEKPLLIHGMGKAVLDGENKYEIITIVSTGVKVQRLHFQNTGYSSTKELSAIKVQNVSGVTIFDNTIENTHFAIYLEFVHHALVAGNTINSNKEGELLSGNGVHSWKSKYISIINNHITGHRDGIYFEFVDSSHIRGNICENNFRYGLHFMFSNYDEYRQNRFTDNGAGVAVMYSRNIGMYDNVFSDNWGAAAYGLLFKDISYSELKRNTIINNTTGVYLEGTTSIMMDSNLYLNNGRAIKIMANCNDNTVKNSDFLGNTFDVSTNGSLVLNQFKNNYWDKYEGYDLNRDGTGDVPYRPVSLYGMIVEKNPPTVIFMRSFMVNILDRVEKVVPSLIPELLMDDSPAMKRNL